MFCSSSDEGLKATSALAETLRNQALGHSDEPNQSALTKAFSTSLLPFEWFELPENEYRRRRFGVVMDALTKLQPPDALLKGGSL